MIYKLLHKLFGWDYVYWSSACSTGIARVNVAAEGTVFYWRYKRIKYADIIKNPNQVIWLTCYPKKYFKTEGKDNK